MSEKTPREQIALLKNVIEDLQERVQTASESISAIVQTLDEQHDEAAQPDFERLRYESEKQAYEGHPAARSTMPELYFLLLVSVLTADDATQAQWRHLYRTAAGAGYEADVRDLLPDAYSLTDAKLIEAVESIKRDELTNAFILDCILLALLHEGDAAALLAYIADLFALLGAEKEVVSETMQVAKIIVAQDCEAYLAAMVDMEHLDAYDNYFYLFHLDAETITSDLSPAPSIDAEHLTVFFAKAKNMELNLDSWQAEEITFQGCRFENSFVKSLQKKVRFIGCTFYEKGANTGSMRLSIRTDSSFTKCTFKDINSERCVLSLSDATIESCGFEDCVVYKTSLLSLNSGTISNSTFVRCRQAAYAQYGLIHIYRTSIKQCIFSYCKADGDKGNVPKLIYIQDSSTIENCRFEHCYACYMIFLLSSAQTNNTFHDCTCVKHVV